MLGVFVWDAKNAELIGNLFRVSSAAFNLVLHGVPAIGNIDDDCEPEIIFATVSRLNAVELGPNNTLIRKWELPTNDSSGGLGLSLFDFDQDQVAEILYRDETFFRIIDGKMGTPFDLGIFSCTSGTGLEMPITADVDDDGEAEVLVTCSFGSAGTTNSVLGDIKIYGSNGSPWAPARAIWHQYNYQTVAINDNLTVPRVQQDHNFALTTNTCGCSGQNRPLNNYIVQTGLLDKQGCPVTQTINNLPAPAPLSLGDEALKCPDAPLALRAGPHYTSYRWSTGQIDSSISVNQAGTYWVEVRDACGRTSSDTIQVLLAQGVENPNLGADFTQCLYSAAG
ncbi:MAG: hypothetical protein HC880_08470 [Bacteroidia bacterium]|nr:hypothetical protein [Bacteroidia bacterium]